MEGLNEILPAGIVYKFIILGHTKSQTMSKQADKIIREKSAEFAHWSETFNSFMEFSYNNVGYSEIDEVNIWMDTESMYADILDTMIRMSGVRDEWEGPQSMPLAVKGGLEVFYRAEKIESLYRFGTDEIGFILYTDLFYAENIRKMNDDFWFMMSELSQLGKLDLWENRIFEDSDVRREPDLHRKSKSTIFSMIRTAIAMDKHFGSCEDLGAVFVRWKYETPWKELLERGAHAFRNLYRINYELWRKRKRDYQPLI